MSSIRCFIDHRLADSGCKIHILVSSTHIRKEGEVSKRMMKEQYGHHLPAAVKLSLDAVDFEGSLHYAATFEREFK